MIKRKNGLIVFTCDNAHCNDQAQFEVLDLGVEPAWRDAHYEGWRRQRAGRGSNSAWIHLCPQCGGK